MSRGIDKLTVFCIILFAHQVRGIVRCSTTNDKSIHRSRRRPDSQTITQYHRGFAYQPTQNMVECPRIPRTGATRTPARRSPPTPPLSYFRQFDHCSHYNLSPHSSITPRSSRRVDALRVSDSRHAEGCQNLTIQMWRPDGRWHTPRPHGHYQRNETAPKSAEIYHSGGIRLKGVWGCVHQTWGMLWM